MDYFPEIIQVIPTNNYKVYVYFDDGSIRLFDASQLIKKGIFTELQDKNAFVDKCTVLNGTLAWDIKGNYDTSQCLDIDPFELYNLPEVQEPIELFQSTRNLTSFTQGMTQKPI